MTIVHFSCQEREKKKNTNNRSPAAIQPCYVYTSHHVEEGAFVHIVIQWMAKFGHRKASQAPP
jgi:hypothetical protein